MSAESAVRVLIEEEEWVQGEYLWSAEAFLRCVEEGIIAEDERVELISGRIVPMSPMGGEHILAIGQLNLAFVSQLKTKKHWVFIQSSLMLDHRTLVDPDLVVVDKKAYKIGAVPTPSMVQLLIEVSKSSLQKDLKQKLPLYAAAGIREVWVVDLKNRCIHQFTEPQAEGKFRVQRDWFPPEVISTEELPGFSLPLKQLFPRKGKSKP